MRTDPPQTGPELDQLTRVLDHQRETILRKADGLTKEQLTQALPTSSLTLGGLLNHLALVEDSWLRVRFSGLPDDELWAGIDWDADPDHEFRTAVDLQPAELRRRYEQACARSREVVAGADSLDQVSVAERQNGLHFDLRWVLLHLIEETARHAGHADLLREAIDGITGE
ncbi:MAG TPA: DinB family protein [Blastococcus sp.]